MSAKPTSSCLCGAPYLARAGAAAVGILWTKISSWWLCPVPCVKILGNDLLPHRTLSKLRRDTQKKAYGFSTVT